jgi:hypothetical protein
MPVVVVISQHLLNVFVQLANKRGLKTIVIGLLGLHSVKQELD